jgi:hypothetical protein
VVQPIEPFLPDVPVALRPVRDGLQGPGLDATPPPLRLLSLRDQPRALEHAEVLRDGGQAHVERLGELGDRAFAREETRQDRPARRVCQGGERVAQLIGCHVYKTI